MLSKLSSRSRCVVNNLAGVATARNIGQPALQDPDSKIDLDVNKTFTEIISQYSQRNFALLNPMKSGAPTQTQSRNLFKPSHVSKTVAESNLGLSQIHDTIALWEKHQQQDEEDDELSEQSVGNALNQTSREIKLQMHQINRII